MNALLTYRKNKGLSQKEVADYIGLSPSGYSRVESGERNPSVDILRKLSELYGVSVDAILGRSDDAADPAESANQVPFGRPIQVKLEPEFENEVFLPIVASLRCGFGSSGEPFIVIGKKGVPASYVKKWGSNIVLNEAVGDSMSPTIRPHDLMVCCPSDWWDDGMVVIANVNDSDTVKRIYRADDGGIDLVPDNPDYRTMHYSPGDMTDLKISVLAHVLTTIPPDIQPIPRKKKL